MAKSREMTGKLEQLESQNGELTTQVNKLRTEVLLDQSKIQNLQHENKYWKGRYNALADPPDTES